MVTFSVEAYPLQTRTTSIPISSTGWDTVGVKQYGEDITK
jgi:hypothetical protein